MFNHRVAFKFGPSKTFIVGIGDTLPSAGAGVGQNHGSLALFSPAGTIGLVDDGGAGKGPIAVSFGGEGFRLVSPAYEVGAGGVAPVHIAPVPAIGIVLIEKVIVFAIENEAVGIVEPTLGCRKMNEGPHRLGEPVLPSGPLIGSQYSVQCFFGWGKSGFEENHAGSGSLAKFGKGPKRRFLRKRAKFDIYIRKHFAGCLVQYLKSPHGSTGFYRQMEVGPRNKGPFDGSSPLGLSEKVI